MSENSLNINQQIDAYVKGKLSEEEILALWAEFAKNPSLLEDLELEIGIRKIIEEEALSKKKAPAKLHTLPTWTWHAAAAAVILIIAFIQVFQVQNKTSLDQFIVSNISPNQIETSDGIRAKDMVITTADSLLNLGFSAFVSGNSEQALALYDQVINNYDSEPYGSKAFLNKGIILYNKSEYDSSIVAFKSSLMRVKNNKMITEKAYWYLGNALVNQGALEEARAAVLQAYSLDGVFRKPAFLLLQKLNYDLGLVDYEDFENQKGN